jgi:hypothetical protein
MAISEACCLWIDQRIEEELQEQKSHRAIGRQIAKEIEKYFETKVDPETIRKRADRQGGTNVPEDSSLEDDSESKGNKKNKGLTADGKPRCC